jgi:hypothetical protein
MAPLRELPGFIFSHEHYGSYLNANGLTVDDEFEKSIFGFVGNTMAED